MLMLSLADLRKKPIIDAANNAITMMQYALSSYSNFKEYVRANLDEAIAKFEQNANRMNFSLSEDQLTLYLISLFEKPVLGLTASHELNQRGHCDITVKLHDYIWHGEAKKHSSGYSYLFKGYSQLTERYSSGTVHSASGGVIIYSQNRNCADVMTNYIKYLSKAAPKIHACKNINIKKCSDNPLVYYSTHDHTTTKLEYEVLHYPVSLYFNPQDK